MLTSSTAARPSDLLIRSARIVEPQAGIDEYLDISIRGGVIAGIGHHLSAAPGQREIDASGLTIMPGFVDPHVHIRVPGGEDVEDIASATAAASRGGYVAIVSMPNTTPVVDTPELLKALHHDAALHAAIPVGFSAAITMGQQGEALTEMVALAEAGAMLFTDDGLPVRSAAVLRRALQYQHVARRPLALHCEDPQLSAGGAMHEGSVSTALGLQGIPSLSEWTMVARDVRIAGSEGGHVHIQHVSAEQSLWEIEFARARGWHVTAEVTPHHLLLSHEAVQSLDTNTKMNPPLRTDADRDALVEALRSGLVDCIATDHAPHGLRFKQEPFEQAPFGVTGLETAFPALYTGLVATGRVTLATVVEALSTGPAKMLGIPTPRIAVGEVANLNAFALEREWAVEEDTLASKSANSCFLGRTLAGRCELTVAAGALAWQRSPVVEAVPA